MSRFDGQFELAVERTVAYNDTGLHPYKEDSARTLTTCIWYDVALQGDLQSRNGAQGVERSTRFN